jgi:hypothetical protein
MAGVADVNLQLFLGAARLKHTSAAASDLRHHVLGMNAFFHDS